MSKPHIVAFSEEKKPLKWSQSRDVKCLCGHTMLDAKPIAGFSSITEFSPKSTLAACSGCWLLATEKKDEATWYYVVLPEDEADRLNANKDEE